MDTYVITPDEISPGLPHSVDPYPHVPVGELGPRRRQHRLPVHPELSLQYSEFIPCESTGFCPKCQSFGKHSTRIPKPILKADVVISRKTHRPLLVKESSVIHGAIVMLKFPPPYRGQTIYKILTEGLVQKLSEGRGALGIAGKQGTFPIPVFALLNGAQILIGDYIVSFFDKPRCQNFDTSMGAKP